MMKGHVLKMSSWSKEIILPYTSEKKTISLLGRREIEYVLRYLVELRVSKRYEEFDILRDRLIEVGYFWKGDPAEYYENFKGGRIQSGHILKGLRFMISKSGISTEGYIHIDEIVTGRSEDVYCYAPF